MSDLRLYKRLLGWAKPYWRIALVSILAMICTAALEPVLPALMKPLVDQSLIEKQPTALWLVPVLIVIAFLLKGVADYISNVASQELAQRVVSDLRVSIFSQELHLSLAQHQSEEPGRMLSRVTYDTSMVGEAVSTAWLTIIRDTLVLIGLVGFLFYVSWQLALLILVMAPVLAFAIRAASRRLRHSNRAVQSWVGRLTGYVEGALNGLREIKIFRAEDLQAKSFRGMSEGLRREQMRVARVQALNVPMVQVLAACAVAAVIYVASLLSAQDALTPGEFVSFITAASMVFEPVRRLTNVNAVLQRGLAAAESIFAILDAPSERSRPTSAVVDDARLRGEIRFEQVAYAYPNGRDVFRQLSFSVSPGEVVAITGPSGEGKSTIFHLLAGFDEPQGGVVSIDGKAPAQWGLGVVRANLALVGQRVVLFDQSIGENILMGRPGARPEEVEAAARAAHAWEFISQLPEGLQTQVGALGDRLSGGQRQRIAIARAFLKDAPILLLDEATSALDKDSEAAVLSGLSGLMAGRTVLLISHAPERLLRVDRVLELRGGLV